ncbi:hypothetical protein BDV98DRAFT_589117 [Pterulicium gracile]|uniref:Uncharacterized protein n=1 Tax=Pterulicium gracile TaxID=1884261 RepID=A0A5C3QU04_9AGAR|nr:hypothetical protein BDV98DRAFT_589117 [Pterula gracilis]
MEGKSLYALVDEDPEIITTGVTLASLRCLRFYLGSSGAPSLDRQEVSTVNPEDLSVDQFLQSSSGAFITSFSVIDAECYKYDLPEGVEAIDYEALFTPVLISILQRLPTLQHLFIHSTHPQGYFAFDSLLRRLIIPPNHGGIIYGA